MFGAALRFSQKALVAALCLMPLSLHAVTVGPLDGKDGPSLAPAGLSVGMAVEELPDTSFPKSLEQLGDIPSAALEWQRLAHKNVGTLRQESLANAARLHMHMQHPDIAASLVKNLLEEAPGSPFIEPALYALATGPVGPAQTTALGQLQTSYPATPYTQAAQLKDVWHQLQTTTKIKTTYNLPQAEELKKRVTRIRVAQQQKIAISGAMGVLFPGAGHAYAGNIPQGVTVGIVFLLFMLAFLSSCRHRHYAYSFLFAIPAAALWLSSPIVAMEIAKDQANAELRKAIATYTDLQPTDPAPTQ